MAVLRDRHKGMQQIEKGEGAVTGEVTGGRKGSFLSQRNTNGRCSSRGGAV